MVGTATALDWEEGLVHREYFVAAAHDTSHDTAFDVRIASDGRIVRVEKDQTVVEALTGIGIAIPTSCSEGVCGTCVTRVLEGEVIHRDLLQSPDERARNDQFTPCCSRAAGPLLVLDL